MNLFNHFNILTVKLLSIRWKKCYKYKTFLRYYYQTRGVTRLDKVRNTVIRESLNFHISIVNRVCAKQLSYFGHVKRMPSFRYPKITLEGIIPGKRLWGRPPMRWLDNIKTNCDFVGLDSVVEAGRVARDRTVWKLVVARQLSPEPSYNVLGGQL